MAYGHKYTEKQDDFIRANYSNVSECVKKFNEKFNTELSYSALKAHANKTLKLKTGFRPWTQEMNDAIEKLLWHHPYKIATETFNKKYGTNFTRKQVECHCVKTGISRKHREKLKKVDAIIKDNVKEKTYDEIRDIVNRETGMGYESTTSICRRSTNLGFNRPHRVWNHKEDRRFIDGKEVPYGTYVRFIGNRFHRLSSELKPVALQIAELQRELADKL